MTWLKEATCVANILFYLKPSLVRLERHRPRLFFKKLRDESISASPEVTDARTRCVRVRLATRGGCGLFYPPHPPLSVVFYINSIFYITVTK